VKDLRKIVALQRTGGYAARLLQRILAILGISLALAIVAYIGNPNAPRYGKGQLLRGEIALADVPVDVVWVDARSREDYLAGHIAGALSINEDGYYSQIGSFLDAVGGGRTVVVYCSKEACGSASSVARMLTRETGFQNIMVLHGGWEALIHSRIRVETGAPEERQAGK